MKYVIFHIQDKLGDRAHVLFFPERMTHATVARGYERAYSWDEAGIAGVYSAGFCYMDNGTWQVESVGSESLRIQVSRQPDVILRDKRILNLHDASGGFFNP